MRLILVIFAMTTFAENALSCSCAATTSLKSLSAEALIFVAKVRKVDTHVFLDVQERVRGTVPDVTEINYTWPNDCSYNSAFLKNGEVYLIGGGSMSTRAGSEGKIGLSACAYIKKHAESKKEIKDFLRTKKSSKK